MYIFGGYSGFYWLNDFHKIDLTTMEWSLEIPRGGNPPSTRFGYVSAVWRDSMFIFGGYDGATWLNDLYEYDFVQKRWSQVDAGGELPSVRSCPSWATYKSSVFVFGGYDGVHRLNDFYEFNAETKMWS
jgi:N-acetylneuraminic acid mutarotase